MQIQGKLYEKFETKQIKETFKKREFVIEYVEGNPMYPQFVLFQLIQEKCDLIDAFEKGTELTVDFNLRGREWTSPQGEKKYFNSLDAWRVTPVANQGGQQAAPPMMDNSTSVDVTEMPDSDDLPF